MRDALISGNPIHNMTTEEIHQQNAAANFEAGKHHAKDAIDEFGHAAEEKVTELKQATQAQVDRLRDTTEEYISDMEVYVRRNPTKSILISLGVGMFMGMFWRR